MGIIKTVVDGQPKGIDAITDKEEVRNHLLEMMHSKGRGQESIEEILKILTENGNIAVIPAGAKYFDWNENIHGKFIVD